MDEQKGIRITEDAMFQKIGRLVMINEELARRLIEIEQAEILKKQASAPKGKK